MNSNSGRVVGQITAVLAVFAFFMYSGMAGLILPINIQNGLRPPLRSTLFYWSFRAEIVAIILLIVGPLIFRSSASFTQSKLWCFSFFLVVVNIGFFFLGLPLVLAILCILLGSAGMALAIRWRNSHPPEGFAQVVLTNLGEVGVLGLSMLIIVGGCTWTVRLLMH